MTTEQGPLHKIGRRAISGLIALGIAASSVHAQETPRGIIRDTEIEALLRDYAAPIFSAAGISKGTIRIVLLGDRSFNAFVTSGRRMFINIGALMDSKTPNEIVGVIAHESGHVAGGHLFRQREQLANAQLIAVAGMMLGLGAMAAGAGNPSANSGAGGVGVMLGAQELATRSLLTYQRGEEQAADRAAIKFLAATGQSPKGMLDTFQRLADDSMFKTEKIDRYLMSHPIPQDRIANLEALAKSSQAFSLKDPAALQARHDLMRAKLYGFAGRWDEVNRRYPMTDMTLPARYARAIINYRYKKFPESLAQIDDLIKSQPENPYFWELKGQVLLESGRARESVAPLRRALSFMPEAGLIHSMLGHALLATGDPGALGDALQELSNASQREPDDAETWGYLATAYGQKGNAGMAEYAIAQEAFVSGRMQDAVNHADKAKKLLPEGSPAALKADDILNYRPHRLN